jgi:AcrR family transcriptional regulator
MSETPAKRRRLSADERRQQLVDVGGELLVSVPLEEVTMQQVAEVAGVSRTLVFHYFPTVRALHLACLERAAADLLESMFDAAMADPDGNFIRGGLDAFIDYICQQPNTFLAMVGYAGTDPEFGKIFDAVRDQIVDIGVAGETLAINGKASPEQTPADSAEIDALGRLMLHGWVAMAEAVVIRWLRGAEVGREVFAAELVALRDDITARLEERVTANAGTDQPVATERASGAATTA